MLDDLERHINILQIMSVEISIIIIKIIYLKYIIANIFIEKLNIFNLLWTNVIKMKKIKNMKK